MRSADTCEAHIYAYLYAHVSILAPSRGTLHVFLSCVVLAMGSLAEQITTVNESFAKAFRRALEEEWDLDEDENAATLLRQPNGETRIGAVPANNKDKLKRTKEETKSKFFDSKVEIKIFNKFEKLNEKMQDGDIEELSAEENHIIEKKQHKKRKHKDQNLSQTMSSVSVTVEKDDELNNITDELKQYHNEKSKHIPSKNDCEERRKTNTTPIRQFLMLFFFV